MDVRKVRRYRFPPAKDPDRGFCKSVCKRKVINFLRNCKIFDDKFGI